MILALGPNKPTNEQGRAQFDNIFLREFHSVLKLPVVKITMQTTINCITDSGKTDELLPFLHQYRPNKMNNPEKPHLSTLSRRQFIGTVATVSAGLSTGVTPTFARTPSAQSTRPDAARPVCIFSKHLQWLPVADMAKTAADLGFDGVDLTVRKGGHVDPIRVAMDLPKAVDSIQKAGLTVPMIATDVIDPTDPQSILVVKTAAQLGIGIYRTAYLPYNRDIGVAKSLAQYKPKFKQLAALNQQHNIYGAYQNHTGTSVGAAVWDLWELLRDIDPRWMGCQYDIKHATAEGSMSWVNGLDVLKLYIRCFDLKDFIWAKKEGRWQPQLVPLGEGMVDYKTYFGLLRQYKLTGPMSIHYEYPLGGAEVGKTQLTIPSDTVLAALKRDLQTVRKLLKEANLAE